MLKSTVILVILGCTVAMGAAIALHSRGAPGNATRTSVGPEGEAWRSMREPLQTGELKSLQGGVDTSHYDPNSGEGFKGRSSAGGGTMQPPVAPQAQAH